MSTIFFDMSIVIASPGRVKGLFVAYPAFSPRAHCRRRRAHRRRHRGGLGRRLAVASRRRAGHCRYVFFGFHPCVRCARASRSGSVLSKVPRLSLDSIYGLRACYELQLWADPAAPSSFVTDRLGFLVRVHQSTWRSVVYVGSNVRGTFLPVGTGFCAGVNYREHAFFFFVTADHVLELVKSDTIYIRMNTKSGEAGPPIPIKKESKFPGIDRRLDLAIFPSPGLHDFYDADYVLLDRNEHNHILEDVWRHGLGDEVATIGLYTSNYGHTKNIPVVRVGHIAMMPDEPVMGKHGYVQAYLIEMRSILGLSGSPVCITVPPMRPKDGGIQLLETGQGAICIGMMLGYHLSASIEDQIIVPQFQQSSTESWKEDSESDKLSLDERNTGFGIVLPIERLFDVMESELMNRSMDQAIDKPHGGTKFRPAGVPIAQKPAASSDAAANQFHLEDFTRLVDVAARKRPQDDQS
jgi:hypothetical protein